MVDDSFKTSVDILQMAAPAYEYFGLGICINIFLVETWSIGCGLYPFNSNVKMALYSYRRKAAASSASGKCLSSCL